jgi:hypothetical protein
MIEFYVKLIDAERVLQAIHGKTPDYDHRPSERRQNRNGHRAISNGSFRTDCLRRLSSPSDDAAEP